MFEGLVHQLILGYLGRFVKDLQKEQLKITLWNEEVLLENIELNLEAFDYLQLPFALKQGRVGKLCIKIPWKKLGRDAIIIILEDVFVCASQRDDQEWNLEAVERREYAGKKAKLAAAELAKLSRRVSDTHNVGESFMSYISAKILDNIQVSIRGFHVQYRESTSSQALFGIRFSSLTVMKQSFAGTSNGRVRGGQVNKSVEILDLELYLSIISEEHISASLDYVGDLKILSNGQFEGNESDYVLAPINVTLSLTVNKSGQLDENAPLYSITAELSGLVISVDEAQLHHILVLYDYLSVCELKEKYGRYRPWSLPISRKLKGWQVAWWQYAQQSVVSDVRKKLKKTSWRYFGQRLCYRRRYVNLYKAKLSSLRQEQAIDESILHDLEQMEKESDVDEILNYRTVAECELQDILSKSSSSHIASSNTSTAEKSTADSRSLVGSRGWLNWLSRGMLGAGGTEDSGQFSGVVSDEVIQDIYEATNFDLEPLSNGDTIAKEKNYLFEIKFSVHQISATLRSRKLVREIVQLNLHRVVAESTIWEGSAIINASIDSVEMVSLRDKKAILLMNQCKPENDLLEKKQPSLGLQIDALPVNSEVELSIKVILQPLEVTCDPEILLNLMEFYKMIGAFKFQHERVLFSLNGIRNASVRLLSKAEYIISRRNKAIWDISVMSVTINIPWRVADGEPCNMVLQSEAVHLMSKNDYPSSYIEDQLDIMKALLNSNPKSDFSVGLQIQDIYDFFELNLVDFEIRIRRPCDPHEISVVEKFSSSITTASCMIPDESVVKQLEVFMTIISLRVHISPSIYGAVLGLIGFKDVLFSKSESSIFGAFDSHNFQLCGTKTTDVHSVSAAAHLQSVSIFLNLENDGESSSGLTLSLEELDMRYDVTELEAFFICLKASKIITYPLGNLSEGLLLLSTGNTDRSSESEIDVEAYGRSGKVVSAERFFCLQHEAVKTVDAVCNKCTIWLYNADLHLYPHIVGHIVGFFDRISAYSIPSDSGKSYNSVHDLSQNRSQEPDFGFHRFGFSNFLESEFSESADIPLDQFPFVTIRGSSSLASLDSSLVYATPNWRSNFIIREREIGSSKPSTMGGSQAFQSPALSSATLNAISPFSIHGRTTLFNLNFSRLRIHFHDSSCSLGTITIPTLKSSLSIQANSVDALFCTAGLTLGSSWSTQKVHEFLWGSAIPHLSPILNIRFKKENVGQLKPRTEISIAIQHTCCILPPEFLAIIIGYFSLPDWHSNGNGKSVVEEDSNGAIIWKFEILDSVMIVPAEKDENQFLNLEIPQLYCSFVNTFSHVLKEIPQECLVQTEKIAKRNDSLNIFGCNVSLSLLFARHEGKDLQVFSDKFGHATIPLISSLSADIWILIPGQAQSSAATCITPGNICCMVRINECEVLVEDKYFLDGIDALIDVVDEFSLIDEQSEAFTSDVLQFIQSKRALKKSTEDLHAASGIIELTCCINSTMVKLSHWGRDSISLEPIAKADMKLTCSGSLQDGMPLRLKLCFSSLVLWSIPNSVRLARFSATCPNLSVLDFCFTTDGGMHEFNITLPALDVWFYPFDWIEILNLLTSCAAQLERTSKADKSLKHSILYPGEVMGNPEDAFTQDSFQSLINSSPLPKKNIAKENITYGTSSLIGKSENIGITFHIPAQICRQSELSKGEVPRQMPGSTTSDGVEDHCEFFTITLSSKFSEVVCSGEDVRLKLKVDKISGTIAVYEDNDVRSWPFFEMFVCFVGLDFSREKKLPYLRVVVQSHRLDVCLSHQVFLFWHGVTFKVPDSRSQFTCCGVELEMQFKKVSVLLTDGRWSCNGPLLEVLMRKSHLCANVTEGNMQGSITSNLLVNYNNINKVVWEPFVEPAMFQLSIIRSRDLSALLNNCMATDIHIEFMDQLNVNLTDSLIECIFRATEMIKDALGLNIKNEDPDSQKSPSNPDENISSGRYAPYIVQNLTSLPLVFRVLEGLDDFVEVSEKKDGKYLEPGSSAPIYINVTPEEQLSRYRLVSSSDRLSEKQLEGAFHHFVTIQFEGTLVPSAPISMDLVGVTCFEADFSKTSDSKKAKGVANGLPYGGSTHSGSPYGGSTHDKRTDSSSSFFSPVVLDVSVQRYSKLIRLYSTVILSNRTLVPLELRFDIPFGFSPKVLDPIYPGKEFPLPLHLAEAGSMRWRPLGRTYLWSEAHNLSSILSRERSGFLRSFVCYPSNPTTDPFRCCISVQDISLPSAGCSKKCPSIQSKGAVKQSFEHCAVINQKDRSKERFLHRVSFSTPLLVKNFLPEAVSLTIESSGVRRTSLLSEVETSFFHIDSSHDLDLAFEMNDRKASSVKFPRPETFSAMARFNGTTFSTSETMMFDSDSHAGPVSVMVEKLVDSSSAAREVCIFVPFLLYNCTDVPLILSESNDRVDTFCAIPSCYNVVEQDLIHERKDGLCLLSGSKDSFDEPEVSDDLSFSSRHHVVSSRRNAVSHPRRFLHKPALLSGLSTILHEKSNGCMPDAQDLKSLITNSGSTSTNQLNNREFDVVANEHGKVKACMYFPKSACHASEVMVRLSSCPADRPVDSIPNSSWSSPFFLLQPSGSTTVAIPLQSKNAASIVSVTSSEISGPITGRTRVITFQPRYVISNACSKDLCYKQKGTGFSHHMGVGRHSHLRWTDTTRELLVSIRFSEPGWQWSGSFLPDHLGDTQVKMRNYASGVLSMTRVEVQHADVSLKDEKEFGSLHGKSGTILIIISDDDTGFMPYRIDNFTKEKIRIYQQKCDAFETTVHSYSSCPYAWDEPCYPHRLIVEVPGERVLGSYTLDDVKEYMPVQLPSNSEKAERTLLVSVHAEGAMKVLSIVDSDHHVFKDKKESRVPWYGEKGERGQKSQKLFNYMEKFSIRFPYIGISVVDSYPQELIFACVKDIKIDLLQSLDQQKLFFQISSLQIDNQLQNTPYPVILSFDHVCRSLPSSTRGKDDGSSGSRTHDSIPEPVLCLTVSKWRNQDVALISFEYVNLRIAVFSLELEQEVLLSLFDFFRMVLSRFHGEVLQYDGSALVSLNSHENLLKESSSHGQVDECASSYKSLPSVVPIGAPWQQIYLLARRQKKIYVEMFELAPIKLTLSFSSTPWKLGHGLLASGETLIHRGLMAFADIDGAHINLRQLIIEHHLASCESFQEILVRHYTRQLFHEMYKVLGSAGVIGNPMGFARSLGLGIKDFLSVPARSSLQNPTGIITGMAKGTTSLLSNTVYAISDAATQMSKAAHKGILAFTFDDQVVSTMEKQQKGLMSHSKGIVNDVLEGLTGLLQSPIKGAEKHGLPGVFSGIALGVTGLVARPAASILEVTGKTAQSIRKRSEAYRAGSQRVRARLPRPLDKEFPLRPYSWEEAVGTSVLLEADEGLRYKDEALVLCKALRNESKFAILTKRLILIISCSNLVNFGKPEFQGFPADPNWVVESEIGLESVLHTDNSGMVVHIVGSSFEDLSRQKRGGIKAKRWSNTPTPLPLSQTNLEFPSDEEAHTFLQVLLATIDQGKVQGWGSGHLIHQSHIR